MTYLRERTLFPPQIPDRPPEVLDLVVVIPAREEGGLLDALRSLARCDLPPGAVEVLVVINGSAEDPESARLVNRSVYEASVRWMQRNSTPRLRFFALLFPDLPPRDAGVGLARKIGMDEACRRLEGAGNPRGVILSLDADSRCDPSYLTAVADHFREHPHTQAASIYFEHPLEGERFDREIYRAVTLYELHLRYFIDAQRYAAFPFAFHTIGSCMAVRCDAYQQQGGMNRRKAGEDFYFLHKFTALGRFAEINDTRVIPSPRPSCRVPFGTGKAVRQFLEAGSSSYRTYAPQSFVELKRFFGLIALYGNAFPEKWEEIEKELPPAVQAFLRRGDGRRHLEDIRCHTASATAFLKRFFRWFNAFQIMKFVHFSRDHFYPDADLTEAAAWLLEESGQKPGPQPTAKELLLRFRELDRSGSGAFGDCYDL